MRIDAPSRNDVMEVAVGMRERDAEEFLAVSMCPDRLALADALTERLTQHPDAFGAYLDDGKPVAVGAMVQYRPNVVTLMFFATDDFPEVALALTRFIVQRLFPQYQDRGIHRIECVSIEGYDEVHRWIELLGLKREAEMPGYGRDGQTFYQFAWVDDDRSPRA